MTSSCCQGIDTVFGERAAAHDLKRYRKRGPSRPTRRLLAELRGRGVGGATVLDIGGGIGAIQHDLLDAGAHRATSVEASAAYLRAAREEAERRGRSDRITLRHGDFTAVAGDVEPADVVTLDRVICCYPDVEALVGRSAERARRLYGLVHPRETWWTRAWVVLANLGCRLLRKPFRAYVHPVAAVDAIARGRGLALSARIGVGPIWQVAVYERRPA
jgi:2-polyprenyl-3-methyl-5-hydroxy-6-metoxy-1,4-benzoquinol methylase